MWICLQPADSCDASGEYTTGDSDEEKESQSSEEFNGSVATCRQVELLVGVCGSSSEAVPDPETTPVAERSLPLSPEHCGSKVRDEYSLRFLTHICMLLDMHSNTCNHFSV
jgi:hypothetical protein